MENRFSNKKRRSVTFDDDHRDQKTESKEDYGYGSRLWSLWLLLNPLGIGFVLFLLMPRDIGVTILGVYVGLWIFVLPIGTLLIKQKRENAKELGMNRRKTNCQNSEQKNGQR
jgi:hypothetical protein